MIDTVRWKQETPGKLIPGKLRLIDQTLLPEELLYVETDNAEEIFDYIKRLVVRGAPAIGCAAALGLAAVNQHSTAKNRESFLDEVKKVADYLAKSRPTAVNLFWALERCVKKLNSIEENDVFMLKELLVQEGINILNEDIHMCRSIGEHGVKLIKDGDSILTHCNAGALATGDYGTALSPAYVANEKGLNIKVYSDETRPLLQGSRLTAWELKKANIDVVTICDNMAAQVMREGKINIVITGADRIAANGDSANKIGTYGVAILAKYHNIPFYIAAPHSTIDMNLKHGSEIPIELREPDEIRRGFGRLTAPADINVYNPAFDVTPNELIAGIITEDGILEPPFETSIKEFMETKKH
ncbi:MAG: S-methyl-5-thioribose-1-phosphate isomerase [bacterium]|nr:S-methyl-5-thioribose-1-phosphate isomerase [bacterium]